MQDTYQLRDLIKLKKKHPCGSDTWEIIRKGADFKIKCTGCEHIIMIERHKLDKIVKKILKEKT